LAQALGLSCEQGQRVEAGQGSLVVLMTKAPSRHPLPTAGDLLMALAFIGQWQAASLLTQASETGEQPPETAAPREAAGVLATASRVPPEGDAARPMPAADMHTAWPDALGSEDAKHLQHLLSTGVTVACCGRWRDQAAARLQHSLAAKLGLHIRRLGDVHLANSSVGIISSSKSGDWGAVAVVYLDEPGDVQAQLVGPQHALGALGASRKPVPRSAVVVADGDRLLHSGPLCMAWVRIRADGVPELSTFDYYIASWIRSNFVAPYDTQHQRRFFRAHTNFPMYWHGFVWSFIGMFCTVFACLPLAWLSVHAASAPSGGGCALNTECHRPLTPGKRPPTLLPLVGPDASRGQAHTGKAQRVVLAAGLVKAVG